MRRVLFLFGHLCSGSSDLYDWLDGHPRVQGYRGKNVYENRMSLLTLTSQPHKADNAAAVYMDEVVFNHSVAHRSVYAEPLFAFVVRDPEHALGEIAASMSVPATAAARYYSGRLSRMVSVASAARDRSVLLTYSDLEAGRGGPLLSSLLRLRDPVRLGRPDPGAGIGYVDAGLVSEATEDFESTLYKLKSLGLATP